MKVHLFGFDWGVYAGLLMPSLERWLLDEDESAAYQLYQQTRCAREEQAMPEALRQLATWSRALALTRRLPRGQHMLNEYRQLCQAEAFTALSDRYAQRYPPQLQRSSEALRTVWGALVERYCLLPLLPGDQGASEAGAASTQFRRDNGSATGRPGGICIGRLPETLHLRGWLAPISVRAMALFEFLACGRRCMPFGYQPGDPFAAYIGYLTPGEVEQLVSCLRDVQAPDAQTAAQDYQLFLRQQSQQPERSRLIDEVLPAFAGVLLSLVHLAAQQRQGLICSVD